MAIIIRKAVESDLHGIISVLNPYIQSTAITFDTEPYTVDTRANWFQQFSSRSRYQCFVAVNEETIVGYANSAPLRPKKAHETSVEVSIYLDRNSSVEGQGIATKLYQTLFKSLGQEDVHRAHAVITLPNERSIALHQRFGFKKVGVLSEAGRKFGEFHNVCWMEKSL